MIKKLFVALLFCCVFIFVGCGSTVNIENCMSEQTTTYFYAQTGEAECSISVGQREKNYKLDGKHGETCDFSLITLSLAEESLGGSMLVDVVVNEEKSNVVLELNPLNMTYMADLGYALNGDDDVKIIFGENEIILENISKNFAVDYMKAIKLSAENMEELNDFYNDGNFVGEGYLKILNGSQFGGSGFFWCFNIVGKEKSSSNVLINTMNEQEILQAFVCN